MTVQNNNETNACRNADKIGIPDFSVCLRVKSLQFRLKLS